MGAKETGTDFLKGILAKLPENLRNQPLEAVLAAAEASDALVTVGESVLARSDYSRHMDDLKKKEDTLTEDYTRLNTWYADRKADLDELDRLRKTGGAPTPPVTPPVTPPALDPSKYLDLETFDKTMRQQQMDAANYLGLQNTLTLSHYKDFGEVLDTRILLADKRLGSQLSDGRVFGLLDAYNDKFAEKLAERDKTRKDAEINKLVEAGVTERLKGMQTQPFPVRGSTGSPLDVLDPSSPDKPEQHTADTAAAYYQKLQDARAAG